MFTFFTSPVGILKITASDSYILQIEFVEKIESESQDNKFLKDVVSQLDEYFRGMRKIFDLPVKQAGTSFQQVIWKFLQEIPFGETATYLDLAKRFGDEKAVRAVGAANGKNKIPIIVPCHRVIGSNGKLMGFAFGIERKQFLLNHEKQYQQTSLFV